MTDSSDTPTVEKIPTPQHITEAHDRIRGAEYDKSEGGGKRIFETPMLYSRVLSGYVNRQMAKTRGVEKIPESDSIRIYVKHENMQVSASYKERGALNKLLRLKEKFSGLKGVVAASAGNHAQGVACHASHVGLEAIIYMPDDTPALKVSRTKDFGAKVEPIPGSFEESKKAALKAAEPGVWEFVDPFDDPDIIAGQGTVALEMLDKVPDLDTLVVPVGGGGLISGVAIAAKARNPDIVVLGVEAKLYPPYYNDRHGILDPIEDNDTIAEGIKVREMGKLNRMIINGKDPSDAPCCDPMVDHLVLVTERRMEEAIGRLIELEKTVVEGAGAAGLAAILEHAANPESDQKLSEYFNGKKVGIILSGGNIDTRLLANIMVRDLLVEHRMARITVVLKDKPGQLVKALTILSEEQINIVDVAQDRLFSGLLAKMVAAQIDCEIVNEEAFEKAMKRLEDAKFRPVAVPAKKFQSES